MEADLFFKKIKTLKKKNREVTVLPLSKEGGGCVTTPNRTELVA
jgi:hypothetical protein